MEMKDSMSTDHQERLIQKSADLTRFQNKARQSKSQDKKYVDVEEALAVVC